jgi:hypothetical protein
LKGFPVSNVTRERFEEICRTLKPQIEVIRQSNREYAEPGSPITDARSAVVKVLLRQLYSDAGLEPPLGVQPVAGPTREGTLKTAIQDFIRAHSDPYFHPTAIVDDLLADLSVGEM